MLLKKDYSQKKDFKDKLAFIIPTKDRPKQIRVLLSSIMRQEYRPIQIIIVDASVDPGENKKTTSLFNDLAIDYVNAYPPSLTRQRNMGLGKVLPEISLIGFLDDDVEFLDGSIKEMFKFWENSEDSLGGAIFNVITDKPSILFWPKQLFFMGNKKAGIMLRSGYNTKICPASKDMYTQWLLGGVTIWRKEVVERFKFDEWFKGYGLFEDLEYSYRVGKQFKLAVVSNAKVRHSYLGINRRDNFQFGKMEIINRHHIVKNNPDLSLALFCWASLGQLLENLLRILLHRKKGYLLRAAGNLRGFLSLTRQGNAKV